MTEATEPPELAAKTAEPAPVAMGSPAKDQQVDYYEPPWREARGRISAAWRRGGTGRRVGLALAAALAAALLGAFVFGLIHVVVGGLVKGNWKAGGFGIALSSVTGVLLWIEAAAALRLLPPASR